MRLQTGSSFGTSLLHLANSSIPDGVEIDTHGGIWGHFPPASFAGSLAVEGAYHGFVGGHGAVRAQDYDRFEGRWFGMFRHPEARARSCYAMHADRLHNASFASFSRVVQGVVTKMLAGQSDGGAAWMCAINRSIAELPAICRDFAVVPNVRVAISRLRGFAFVGLTDDWASSICLFHLMFGGRCLAAERRNVRPGQCEHTVLPC